MQYVLHWRKGRKDRFHNCVYLLTGECKQRTLTNSAISKLCESSVDIEKTTYNFNKLFLLLI